MLLFLKNLLFTLIVPGTVTVYIPLLISQNSTLSSNLSLMIAIFLFCIGGALYFWCLWDFASFGGGTPALIDSPKKLVVRGLYRYSRNPMFAGVLIILVGWAVMFQIVSLLIHLTCVALSFQIFIIVYEERHLQTVFGDQYKNYFNKVDRWFPKLPRKLIT